MKDVRLVADELARVLEESGISARGAMHALARAADEGEGSAVTAVLVRDGNSFCLFYGDGRREGVLAVPSAGAQQPATEAVLH